MPDGKGRVKVRLKHSEKEREVEVPRECVGTEKEFIRVRRLNTNLKYVAEAGDYVGRYDFRANGTATKTHEVCSEGNCENDRKFTVAADCPRGKLAGTTCTQTAEIFRVRDYYAFRMIGEKVFEDFFTLDFAGKPVALRPSP